MAMEIYVKGTKEKIYMNGLSITNCADKASFVPKREEKSDDSKGRFDDGVGQFGVYLSNVIEMTRGKQKLIAVNSTNNIVQLVVFVYLKNQGLFLYLIQQLLIISQMHYLAYMIFY